MFDRGMTNAQFNMHLETLAKLIEKTATSVEDAAQIVRDAKLSTASEEHTETAFSFVAENLALPEVHVESKPVDESK